MKDPRPINDSLNPETMPKNDPLHHFYRESLGDANPTHFKFLADGQTALLCIDLQYLDAAPGHGVFRDAESSGVSRESQEYYFQSLEQTVLPNVRRLQEAFRLYRLEVLHTRIQSLTRDGRDRSNGHKRLHLHAAPGSKEAEFLEEVAPAGDEIVINKTASGVFSSTNLNYVLKNVGINALFIVGVYTNECVETTVRDACDLGYLVTLAEDCCTTVTPELHQASLAVLRNRYARVVTTDDAIKEIEAFVSTSTIDPKERLRVH
jgi:nicotinamidase-related amidase